MPSKVSAVQPMTPSMIKIAALFAATCTGFALHAVACPTQRTATAQPAKSQVTRFAIAGLIDIDNDGKSDIDLIRRLIKMSGGVVDAEIHIDGTSTGYLRRDTAYVIVDKLPGKTTVAPIVAQQFDASMRRVTELNLRVIQLDELLEWGNRRTTAESDAGSLFRQRSPPPRRGGSEY